MDNFNHIAERFGDIQMLRYQLSGFEALSLSQKLYIYYLSEATLWGRDITFDQFGKYNMLIRRTLEVVYVSEKNNPTNEEQLGFLTNYLKRIWFSNGIYHHYSTEKIMPEFTEDYFTARVRQVLGNEAEDVLQQIMPVMFDPTILPKRVNKTDGDDVILTSACNYYENLTQRDVEEYYANCESITKPTTGNNGKPSLGLNSTLIKDAQGYIFEDVWHVGGRYSDTLQHIVDNLSKALNYAENEDQRWLILHLISYYISGDLRTFDNYSIKWVKSTEGMIDFINGFIEVYGDPLGIKASWEGIVEYKDLEACKRTQTICSNAQWFEDNSPVDPRYRKPVVKGVTANVVRAAMLGGDEYPTTAIGINLPNADWIRAQYGSKSVTISNITDAYNKASKGNGFLDEFTIDADTVNLVKKYGDICDDLHTDLHECLGHGSGQLIPGVDNNALKNYSSTIEEARADLFGLYYIADQKLIELGLVPDAEAYKSQYYTYLMNGLLTQCVRIKLGNNIEEDHMRNRALIAHWVLEHSHGAVELLKREEKTFLKINDYDRLRSLFAELLAEVQRIKSEGDLDAARNLVEKYGIKINIDLHKEILSRYETLNIAPNKGFLNPRLNLVMEEGTITDVIPTYDETMEEQMLRYSKEYSC